MSRDFRTRQGLFLFCLLFAVGFLSAASAEAQGVITNNSKFLGFGNPSVYVTVEHPPGLGLDVDRVAFLPQDDECATELANDLVEIFLHEGLNVLEREQLEAILLEHNITRAFYVDPETAVELGHILGATAFIFVEIQRCVVDKNRIVDGEGDYRTYKSITEGFLRGSVRVVDLRTARVFSAKSLEENHREENKDGDRYPEHPSPYAVHDAMLEKAAYSVYKMFFPWKERRKLVFFDDGKCDLKTAFRMLQIGDLGTAEEQSRSNVATCQGSPDAKNKVKARAHYNLGMTLLLQENYDEALEQLETAFRLKPGKAMQQAIQECKRARRLSEEMSRYEVASGRGATTDTGEEEPQIAADDGIEGRLAKLKSLWERGLISDEEYEAKKTEILSDL